MPVSHKAPITEAAMISTARGTPRDSSQPPARLPGALTSTITAVAMDAAPVETPCSARNVGSHTMIEVHCAT